MLCINIVYVINVYFCTVSSEYMIYIYLHYRCIYKNMYIKYVYVVAVGSLHNISIPNHSFSADPEY